jgi:two-component system, sensor histidine kinase and response regulator
MRKLVIIMLILSSCVYRIGAQSNVKPLLEELQSATSDTSRVNVYYSISRFYWDKNADSALLIAQKGLDLARKINFKKGEALCLLTKGVVLVSKGEYPEALDAHFQALKLSEELGLDGLTANNYNNIGIVYISMDNNSKALEYFKKSLQSSAKYGDQRATFSNLVNIAEIYTKDGYFDLALEYDMKALQIGKNIRDSAGMAIALFNVGNVYCKKENYDKALTYLREALALSERIHDKEGVAYCYNSMAQAFERTGHLGKSVHYAGMGLREAASLGSTELIRESYAILYAAHERLQNFEKALYYRNMEIGLKDSMFTIEKERKVNGLQSSYDLAQKQHQIDLLNKNKIIQQEAIEKEKFQRLTFTAAALLLSFALLFLIWNNVLKRRKNRLLKKQNEEITRQKLAITKQHAKIHEQNILLEKSNAVKNRLFSIVSHDLRSPLNSLQGIVSLMEIKTLSEAETKKISSMIALQVNTTAHLLDNLLSWAKNQMESLQAAPKEFDLQHAIAEGIQLMQWSADSKNIKLKNEIENAIPVIADTAMIDIVIRNLIGNAIKFSKANDVVSVTAIPNGKFVKVIVKDTGQGISLENQSKIFINGDTFTTPGTSNEKGTGLGLGLCKELVEKNGGRIWFESQPGKGSSFMFTIPK